MGRELRAAESGLEGVIAAETVLSRVDGARGRLVVRGYDVEDVAGRFPFEAICALLWEGEAPSSPRAPEIGRELGEARVAAFERLGGLGRALEGCDGMTALRASLAQLPSELESAEEERIALTAAVAVYAACWWRARTGAERVRPDPALSHAADFLRMVEGDVPDEARWRALDTYLVTVADHGMNASTFTARVVASTHSDTTSAIVAAIGALKGPRHGGVPGPVLDMLDAIGHADRAAAWLESELAAGRRIMGMGHRVYRVRDPRAAVFERAVCELAEAGVGSKRLALARAVEREACALLESRHPERSLEANVEFYTAVLLDAIGLPSELFTPTFAVARVAGWLAHVSEQRESGRLIRPLAAYVGPLPAG